jgi:hypothetical protein
VFKHSIHYGDIEGAVFEGEVIGARCNTMRPALERLHTYPPTAGGFHDPAIMPEATADIDDIGVSTHVGERVELPVDDDPARRQLIFQS